MRNYLNLPNDKRDLFAENQAKKEKDIERALMWIKADTEGLFTLEMEFIGSEIQWENIMTSFKKFKKLFLSSDSNNKELVSQFIAKRHEFSLSERYYSLARVIRTLLAYEAQENDKDNYNEWLLWEQTVRRAMKIAND